MSDSVHTFKATRIVAWIASGMSLIFPILAYAVVHDFWAEYAGWSALSVMLMMLVITISAWRQQLFGRLVFDERLGIIEQQGVSPFRIALSAVKSVEVEVDLRDDAPPYGSIKIIDVDGETYQVREVFFGTTTQTIAIIQLAKSLLSGKVHET